MDHHILTMAGRSTDANWFIETLLREARRRNLVSHAHSSVIATRTLGEAEKVLRIETNLTAILTGVHSRKLIDGEQIPSDSVSYLTAIRDYRSSSANYIPLIIIGNYDPGSPAGKKTQSLEHAASLVNPDVSVVERRYQQHPFSSFVGQIAGIFETPEKFRNNYRLLYPHVEEFTDVCRTYSTGLGPDGINPRVTMQTKFDSLPEHFTIGRQ